MQFSSVFSPAFAVASPVTIELRGKQYKRHTGGSRYPEASKAHHCWFRLDSGSWPGMTKFIVFFRRINSGDTRGLSPLWLCVSLLIVLIAPGSMKSPTGSQWDGFIPYVSKGISCP